MSTASQTNENGKSQGLQQNKVEGTTIDDENNPPEKISNFTPSIHRNLVSIQQTPVPTPSKQAPLLPLSTKPGTATANTAIPPQQQQQHSTKKKKVAGKVLKPLRKVGRLFRREGHVATESHFEDTPFVINKKAEEEKEHQHEQKIRSIVDDTNVVPKTFNNVSDHLQYTTNDDEDNRSSVVWKLEKYLRQIIMLILAYLWGAYNQRPNLNMLMKRFFEYVVVAWFTCMILIIMERKWFIKKNKKMKDQHASNVASNRQTSILSNTGSNRKIHLETLRAPTTGTVNAVGDSKGNDVLITEHDSKSGQSIQLPYKKDMATAGMIGKSPNEKEHKNNRRTNTDYPTSIGYSENDREDLLSTVNLPHESLEPFFLIDTTTSERIIPNKLSELHVVDNEYFMGNMLMMLRTPDVDSPESFKCGNNDNNIVVDYLRGKQRRWEIQFQIKLKKLPDGKKVFFACELDVAMKLGIIQRAFVGAALAFIKKTNPSFHYSLTGSKHDKDGNFEKPHMSFPAEISMDRFVISKPGDILPKLGDSIHEDPESIKRRKKGTPIQYNLEDTYTLALWTAYVDFLDWKVINLPGLRPFQLTNVIGTQCINMVLYLIDDDKATENHLRKDIDLVTDLQISNVNILPVGKLVKDWLARRQLQERPRFRTQSEDTNNAGEDDEDNDDEDDDDDEDDEEECEEDMQLPSRNLNEVIAEEDRERSIEETVAELGEGIYIRSGDSVILKESTDYYRDGGVSVGENNGAIGIISPGLVTNGGGFAIVQDGEQDTSSAWTIIIQKAKRRVSKSSSRRTRNELIKNGDTVTFKLLTRGGAMNNKGKSGEDLFETKYLSIHRGWWLKWVSSAPTKNGCFTICTHSDEECLDTVGVEVGRIHHDSVEIQSKTEAAKTQVSPYLTVGGSFSLRHKRWKKYRVGVANAESATYGGRMLGLYIPSPENAKDILWDNECVTDAEEKYSEKIAYDDEDNNNNDIENNKRTKGSWMNPLQLRAFNGITLNSQTSTDRNATCKTSSTINNVSDNPCTGDSVVNALSEDNNDIDNTTRLVFSSEDSRVDVPAWVEMMNRKDRVRQLAYVVRVISPQSFNISNNDSNSRIPPSATIATTMDNDSIDSATAVEISEKMRFIRLRTGIDLAQIIKVGLDWKNNPQNENEHKKLKLPNSKSGQRSHSPMKPRDRSPTRTNHGARSLDEGYLTPTKNASPQIEPSSIASLKPIPSLVFDSSIEENGDTAQPYEGIDQWDGDSDAGEYEESGIAVSTNTHSGGNANGQECFNTPRSVSDNLADNPSKGRVKHVSKFAKNVVKTTLKSGVTVVKTGGTVAKKGGHVGKQAVVGVGKGTVHVGKAIFRKGGGRKKNPPYKEPKSGNVSGKSRRRRNRDLLHVTKTMKRMGSSNILFPQPEIVAGELSPPEQSYRTVSNLLSRMSSQPPGSPLMTEFNRFLSSQIVEESELDTSFLHGGATQLGVVPPKRDTVKGLLLHECNVARCLWETHWREEWCGLYENFVTFYAPFGQKSSLELCFIDIQSVRNTEDLNSPLPGFPILAIETAWLCHYIAFVNYDARECFRQKMEEIILKRKKLSNIDDMGRNISTENVLWKARFWQGFQNSAESSLSSGRGKWAEVSVGKKTKSRTILNSRRMVFDLNSDLVEKVGGNTKFVQELLSTSLSFSLASLEKDPEALVKFLDATSHLRSLSLLDIDRSSSEAFCLFTNLYHCLLQHALLLAVSGPLHRRTVRQFMRTSCYEVGGDVFSLAEIHCCIIRGNMSRPVAPKSPYVDVAKKASSYLRYALDFKEPTVNFILNTSDVACPQDVPVLVPNLLEKQLSVAASTFLTCQVIIDLPKRTIILPKVCDVYRNDFLGGDALSCLRFCTQFLDESLVSIVHSLITDDGFHLKYLSSVDQFHSELKLRQNDLKDEELQSNFL